MLLLEIKHELLSPRADSAHIIRSLLYYFLVTMNRNYALFHKLSLDRTDNHHATKFRQLLEKHIREFQRVSDYSDLLGISRVPLNKAVVAQFSISASQLLRQRLIFEIKHLLLHLHLTSKEIAHHMGYSDPNHLSRFFKQQTGQTIREFLLDYQNGSV